MGKPKSTRTSDGLDSFYFTDIGALGFILLAVGAIGMIVISHRVETREGTLSLLIVIAAFPCAILAIGIACVAILSSQGPRTWVIIAIVFGVLVLIIGPVIFPRLPEQQILSGSEH